jgi:hypothetical protein
VKTDFADITVVLDRSGSMSSVQDDTIGGFNSFIEAQRKVPGECNASLVQFDDQYEVVYTAKPVKDAPALTRETFVPRGMTALLDAIGRTINATGKRLEAMPEADRPSKVIFVILTDGGENSSKEYTREQVFKMITHQKAAYQWDFVFLGANQDAISAGASIGIGSGSTMTYASNAAGTKHAFASASGYAMRSRTVGKASFTDEDREKQKKAGA